MIQDLPPNKKALGCMWVYKIKYNVDETIKRYKARLAIFTNHQIEEIDYTETFFHVQIWLLCVHSSAAKHWELHQIDMHNAFLHGDLHEKVYMKLPPGFQVASPWKICILQKSFYGLEQAPRC